MKINSNKNKFIATIIILFSIPFLILSNHFLNTTREMVRKNTLERISLRTKIVSQAVSGVLNSNYEVFRIADSEKFIRLSSWARKKLLKAEMEKHKEVYREFALFTPTRKKLFSLGEFDDYDSSRDGLLKQAALSGLSVGAVEYSPDEPASLLMAEPILSGKSKKPKFIAFGKISLASLNNLTRSFGKKSRSELGIADAGGQIISDSTGKAIIKPGIRISNEIIKVINFSLNRNIQNSSLLIVIDDKKILVAVSKVRGTKWWVYEKVNSSTLLDYSFWAKRIVFTGILLIIIFAFVSHKLAKIWLVAKKSSER